MDSPTTPKTDPGAAPQTDQRSITESDYDKILYSSYLRRLSGVTQVFTPNPALPRQHSRLAHSMKVSAVAREIANDLNRRNEGEYHIDAAAAAAAGLAHDFGHPPFGHAGETIINHFLYTNGCKNGFEGNAQTFRIVTVLDRHTHDSVGLELSNITLAAIAKYPWTRKDLKKIRGVKDRHAGHPPKFSAYETERAHLISAVPSQSQSYEASVMDIADDITYAWHDVEDAYVAHMLDFRQVVKQLNGALVAIRDGKATDPKIGANAFLEVAAELGEEFAESGDFDIKMFADQIKHLQDKVLVDFMDPFDDSDATIGRIRGGIGKEIEGLIGSVTKGPRKAWPSRGNPAVYLGNAEWHRIQVLKTITRRFLIQTPKMGLVERGQNQVLRNVLRGLGDWIEQGVPILTLPEPLRSRVSEHFSENGRIKSRPPISIVPHKGDAFDKAVGIYRAVADYVSGLSDLECFMLQSAMRGHELPAGLQIEGWE